MIDRAIETELARFKGSNPRLRAQQLRQATASFQHGVAARVAARLDVMHDEREAAVHAQRATGRALMLVKQTIVDDAFRQTDIRLVSIRSVGRRVVSSAYREGLLAGDRVNLSRPMTGEGRELLA